MIFIDQRNPAMEPQVADDKSEQDIHIPAFTMNKDIFKNLKLEGQKVISLMSGSNRLSDVAVWSADPA